MKSKLKYWLLIIVSTIAILNVFYCYFIGDKFNYWVSLFVGTLLITYASYYDVIEKHKE